MAFIKKGQKVSCLCSLFLNNGECLDENDKEPLPVIAGCTDKGNAISKSVSMELVGMSVKEVKYLKVPPRFAFGEKDENKIFKVSRYQDGVRNLGDELTMEVIVNNKTEAVDGRVVRFHGEYAYVDTNHPFAGETLTLRIQVISFG